MLYMYKEKEREREEEKVLVEELKARQHDVPSLYPESMFLFCFLKSHGEMHMYVK